MAGIDDGMLSEGMISMPNYANTVAIGDALDNKISIVMKGKLQEHISGMRRYVLRAEGVTEAELVMVAGEPVIIVTCEPINDDDTIEQVRIRIRNRCRDWFHDVTGMLTNMGIAGNYVDLLEDAKFVA